MSKIFINGRFRDSELYKGKIWSAKNGATRRELVLIVNDKDFPDGISGKDLKNGFVGRLGWLDKGNHSFIFINKDKRNNDREKLAIILNSDFAFEVYPIENLIYSNYSSGGAGNTRSKFAIVKQNTLVEEHTYKNRTPASYLYFDENGIHKLGTEADIYSNMSNPLNEKAISLL